MSNKKNEMNKFSVLLFFSSLLFYNFQCNDCEDELHDQSSFTANISPLIGNYNIGDTISIGTNFSPQIPLKNTQTTYNNSNQMISFVVQVFEVKPNNELITDGIEDFDVISRIGEVIPSPYHDDRLAKEISNTCDNDKCDFRIEFVPKKKGIYCFSLLNSRFGEADCQYLSLINNDFGLNENNFEICQEINTSSFRLLEGGVFYPNPSEITRFYFFKVS